VILSVVVITHNEEANIGRTLASVQPLIAAGKGEIIVVDSGSTDRTIEIAKSFGAKVFIEEWEGYAAQKNSAIDKATGEWILSLDADEEVSPDLAAELANHEAISSVNPSDRSRDWCLTMEQASAGSRNLDKSRGPSAGYWISRKNHFLGRWIKHGGFWPDPKLRLFRNGAARFEKRLVHEDAKLIDGASGKLKQALLHHSYPTLADYIDHMNRYSSLGAEMTAARAAAASACSTSSYVRSQRSSTTISSGSDFSTAAKACFCTSTTPSMCRGNTRRPGNSRAQNSRRRNQRPLLPKTTATKFVGDFFSSAQLPSARRV